MSLALVPVSLREANAFVALHHRHSKPVQGHKFSIGVIVGPDRLASLVGVAIIGRPIARHNDDGFTLELLRVATDGTRNACSFLEGAASRATFAQGYRRLVTYTRKHEGGASLRAAGFRVVAEVKPREWSRPNRPRALTGDTEPKWLWERVCD